MRLNRCFFSLSCSLLCLSTCISAKATTVTLGNDYFMSVSNYASGEQMSGGYFVGFTTITLYADNSGVQGNAIISYSSAYCIDFNDKIHTPVTYLVEAQGVGSSYNAAYSPTPGSSSTTLTNQKLKDDSELGLGFNGNLTNDINLQTVVWDEGGAWFTLNSTQQNEANIGEAAALNFGSQNAIAFLEINGDGQSFMVNMPSINSSPAPEPSTLLMVGTGVLGAVGAVRRRLRNV